MNKDKEKSTHSQLSPWSCLKKKQTKHNEMTERNKILLPLMMMCFSEAKKNLQVHQKNIWSN